MSNPNDKQPIIKGRKPDVEFHTVSQEDGKTVWTKIGAVWKNDKGYLTGEIGGQKVVGQTREAKEALFNMRDEQQKPAAQIEHPHTPSQ